MEEQEPKTSAPEKDVTEGSERFVDFRYDNVPDAAETMYQEADNRFLYRSQNGFCLQIQVYSSQILRFRYSRNGRFQRDFSYSLDPDKSWSMPKTTTGGSETFFFLETEDVVCRISKEDLSLELLGAADESLLCADAGPFQLSTSILTGTEAVKISKKAAEGERYYGLGDKTGALNLRGQKLENWNTDSFAFTKDMDPLYRSIPFYYGLTGGKGYGIFLHNTGKSYFDFDAAGEGVISFWSESGEMDYFFINGPQLLDVTRRYHDLTGRPELPPAWAFGYHQSRWSYFPEDRVREVAKDFRKHRIPCDAIYLDIDYMRGYRCFTWNADHFPDPKGLIKDLEKEGFQTVVMIDPGIRVDEDYLIYRDGLEKDVFCRRSSGELMIGPVWPPHCVFPDYTDPKVRKWWGPLYQELYVEQGVSGFWNDMNEPAIFKIKHKTFPDNVIHDYDGNTRDHRQGHNVYGMQMSRATQEGLKELRPEKRPFVLTRASFSGGQRFASVWTGDNRASWEHLRLANIQCQRLSLSGFSFVGSDIGGFAGQPDGELLVRWLQLGVFHPFMRVHSMGNNVDGAAETDAENIQQSEADKRLDQEPWAYGEEYTDLARKAIEFRYRLFPYIYTAFRQNVISGDPIIRSLVFYDQSDEKNYDREEEFLFGDHILVSPLLGAGLEAHQVQLPAGTWLDYYTGIPYQGRQMLTVKPEPDRLPLYVKAGAVIPNYPVQQFLGEKKIETIQLRLYYGQGQNSYLYEDEGKGYGYRKGLFCLRNFQSTTDKEILILRQKWEGTYQSDCRNFEVTVFGLPFALSRISVDGRNMELKQDPTGQIRFTVDQAFEEIRLS